MAAPQFAQTYSVFMMDNDIDLLSPQFLPSTNYATRAAQVASYHYTLMRSFSPDEVYF
jgi:hypothetical protein